MSEPGTRGPDLAGWLEHVETAPVEENVPESAPDLEREESPSPSAEPNYVATFTSRKHLMPHWKNVLEAPRNGDSGSLKAIMFEKRPGSWELPAFETLEGHGLNPAAVSAALTSLSSTAHETHRGALQHAVLVTDLSGTLINSLGPTFNLSPEIFEEHLVQSGYTKASYEDPDPSTWPTRFLRKQHVSLRWHSLVQRKDVEPREPHLRDLLIQDRLVWQGSIQSRGPKKKPLRQKRFLYTVNNIFRREWPLASMFRAPTRRLVESESPRGLVDFEEDDKDDFEDEWLEDSPSKEPDVVAWEERVTFCWGQLGEEKTPILLLDPLPRMKLKAGVGSAARTLDVLPFSKRLAPRGPPKVQQLTSDPTALDELSEYITEASDASSEVVSWIDHLADARILGDNTSAIDLLLLAVFQIVRQDTATLLGHIGRVLDQISSGSMDERMMQEQLGHWRSVLGRLQSELPALEKSMGEFFAFPYNNSNTEERQPPQLTQALQKLQKDVSLMTERCQKSQEYLRAEMSLLESKRGIEEAESVSRLTELAFIFIPMTFAAGLFSMQVKELVDDPPRVYFFVIAAVVAVAVSYGLRLVQRSTMVAEAMRRWENEIRSDKQITTRVIPVRKVMGWLVQKLSAKVLIVVVGIGASALLLVPVWTRDAMDTSFKGTITAFSLFVILLAVIYALYSLGPMGMNMISDRGSGVTGFGRIWRSPDEEAESEGGTPAGHHGSGSDSHV